MYLRRLAERHGNDWPTAALDRLLWLHSAQACPPTFVGASSAKAGAWAWPDLADEYQALLTWARQAVEAGIAFQQSAGQ